MSAFLPYNLNIIDDARKANEINLLKVQIQTQNTQLSDQGQPNDYKNEDFTIVKDNGAWYDSGPPRRDHPFGPKHGYVCKRKRVEVEIPEEFSCFENLRFWEVSLQFAGIFSCTPIVSVDKFKQGLAECLLKKSMLCP